MPICGTRIMIDGTNNNPIQDVFLKLRMAQISSCSCLTKTNVHTYHAVNCRYRLLEEIAELLKDIK